MKSNQPPLDSVVREFREGHRLFPKPKLTTMRGNLEANILIIAPAPTASEIEQNMPLSSDSARFFHDQLLEITGIDTNASCLVVPGSVCLKKPSKNTVAPFKSLTLKICKRYKLVICIGGDNFKFIFGNGKKSSLQTLASGNFIYLPPVLGKTPLFVFPDIDLLVPDLKIFPKDEHWKIQRMSLQHQAWILRLCVKLSALYNQ